MASKPARAASSAIWMLYFFFSSRRRHTRYWRDWSSDVCSSDLYPVPINDVSLGGDYADGSENAPTGEFSARTVRQAWDPQDELNRIVQSDIAELVNPEEVPDADARDERRLTGIAEKMLGES